MKIKVLAILTVVAVLHLVVLGVISLSGGCRHPEVLQPRGNVPPPAEEPGNTPADFTEKEAALIPPPATNPKAITDAPQFKNEQLKHTVKANESLWKVARMYGVSTGELAAENKIGTDKVLKVGTVLTIPPGGSLIAPEKLQPATSTKEAKKAPVKTDKGSSAAPKKSAKGESLPADGTYIVKANDSLWKIAVKYGLKRKDIADANKISESKPLQVGQKIILPASGSSSAKASSAATTDVTKTTTESTDTQVKDDLGDLLKEDKTTKEVVTEKTVPATGAKDVKVEETVTETEEVVTEPAAAAPAAKDFISHETTEGETLESISALYGFTVNEIIALNPGMTKNGKIPPFTKVKIPRAK